MNQGIWENQVRLLWGNNHIQIWTAVNVPSVKTTYNTDSGLNTKYVNAPEEKNAFEFSIIKYSLNPAVYVQIQAKLKALHFNFV